MQAADKKQRLAFVEESLRLYRVWMAKMLPLLSAVALLEWVFHVYLCTHKATAIEYCVGLLIFIRNEFIAFYWTLGAKINMWDVRYLLITSIANAWVPVITFLTYEETLTGEQYRLKFE